MSESAAIHEVGDYDEYTTRDLLDQFPVSRKDNLQNIAKALEIEFDPKDKKVDLLTRIEEAFHGEHDDENEIETKIRKYALAVLDEYEKQKAEKKKTKSQSTGNAANINLM